MTIREQFIAACAARGIPAPPTDADFYCGDGSGVVIDWRHPIDGAEHTPATQISFRWRLIDERIVTFAAYGWHARRVGYGRLKSEPEMGYSILSGEARDAAARMELGA